MYQIDKQYIKKRKKLGLAVERIFISLVNLGRQKNIDKLGAVRSILLIRHNHLGDAVAASPFVSALREKWPHARIDVLASKYNSEVFGWVDGIDQVIVRPELFSERLRVYRALRNKYDLVFQTLYDEHYFKRSMVARLIAGNQGLSVGRKRGSPLEEAFDEGVYLPSGGYVGKLMALLGPFTGMSPSELIQRHPAHSVRLPDSYRKAAQDKLHGWRIQERDFVALNISARAAFRVLGVEQSAGLARMCMDRGRPVVLLYGPEDAERAKEIKSLVPELVLSESPSLGVAMALAQLAKLYLGADTGTAHFAAAGGTPCVVLFSFQARADVWAPYGVPFAAIQANVGQPVSEIEQGLIEECVDRMLAGEKLHRFVKSTPAGFSFGV